MIEQQNNKAKSCRYCRQIIPGDAVKCYHCREIVDDTYWGQTRDAEHTRAYAEIANRELLVSSKQGALLAVVVIAAASAWMPTGAAPTAGTSAITLLIFSVLASVGVHFAYGYHALRCARGQRHGADETKQPYLIRSAWFCAALQAMAGLSGLFIALFVLWCR